MRRFLTALTALTIVSFALAACGGDDEESSTTAASEETTEAAAGSEGGDASTITAEADPGGGLAWTETEITGAAGPSTLEMVNESSTPHNLLVEDENGEVLAETDVASGANATASADLEAGSYTFFCDIPGHREAGMEGTLTIE